MSSVQFAAEISAPKSGNGAMWLFNEPVENRGAVGEALAAGTGSLSPVFVAGGVGRPARWPVLQFLAVKVKK